MNDDAFADILDIYESQYARDLDGRLIRIEKATQSNLTEDLTVRIDDTEVVIKKAVPATDDQGNIRRDAEGRVVPRLTTILDAAVKRYGASGTKHPIPVLCHQEHLQPIGVCRVCSVLTVKKGEVAGKLAPACHHPLVAGMEVHTRKSTTLLRCPGEDAERPAGDYVQENVALLLEFLASQHLHQAEAPGQRRYHNELHALCAELGVRGLTVDGPWFKLELPLRRAAPVRSCDSSSPIIGYDPNQCILCDRCVRSCSEVKPFKIIGHTGFGHNARISFDLDQPMGQSECKACGECAISCPTGALTFKGTVYAGRDPWHDQPAPKPVTVPAAALALHPLFAGVPYAFLKWNEGAVGRLKCPEPRFLCRRGEYGATAFVIENGEIELLVGPDEKFAGVKTKADLILGEMACLANQERTATLRARAGAEVLVVRRNMLHMLQRNKAAREELYPRYRERAIDAYLRRGQLFRGLSEQQNERCAAFLRGRKLGVTFLQADPGQLIVRQGADADWFGIIYRGNVSVSERSPSGVDTVLDYLGTGRHFGEIGLMTALEPALAALAPAGRAGVRTASCTALDHVELVRIDRDAFADLLVAEPAIRAVFRAECEKILAKNASTRVRLDHDLDEFTQDGLPQGQNLLVLDLEKCTRCQECVKACADSHQGTTRLILAGKQFDRWLVPSACRSCFDPECLNGCPVDAIHRKPSERQRGGAKSLAIVIEDHCIGCGLCAYNCPFGSIHMKYKTAKPVLGDPQIATNCDLCESLDGKPRCVYGCPHDAAIRLTGLEFARKVGMHPLGPLVD